MIAGIDLLEILKNTIIIGMVTIVIYILYTREWVQMTMGLIVLFINAGLLFLIIGIPSLLLKIRSIPVVPYSSDKGSNF